MRRNTTPGCATRDQMSSGTALIPRPAAVSSIHSSKLLQRTTTPAGSGSGHESGRVVPDAVFTMTGFAREVVPCEVGTAHEVGGCAEGDHPLLGREHPGGQACGRVGLDAAHRHVDGSRRHGRHGVVEATHGDGAALGLGHPDRVGEPVGQQPREPDGEVRRGPYAGDQGVEVGEDPPGVLHELDAGLGQARRPRRPDDEVAAHHPFEVLDRARQRGLADGERRRGRGEGALVGQGHEGPQVPHLGIHALRLYLMLRRYFRCDGPLHTVAVVNLLGAHQRVAWAGAGGLVAAMGVGRFAFTPLLPVMQADHALTSSGGALVATANYAGYLAGAAALAVWPRVNTSLHLRAWAVLLIGSEALMAVASGVGAFSALRFVAGVASAVVFVGCISTVSAARRHGASTAVTFSGVGIGIALSGAVVAAIGSRLGWQDLWLVSAALTAVFLLPMLVTDVQPEASAVSAHRERSLLTA